MSDSNQASQSSLSQMSSDEYKAIAKNTNLPDRSFETAFGRFWSEVLFA